MTRKRFVSDLHHASEQAITNVSHVHKGDDDGEVVFTFSHAILPSPVIIRLVTLSIDDYPDLSGFLAFTDDESIPQAVSQVFDDLPSLSQNKSILDTLNFISRKFSAALATDEDESDSDVEMINVDSEDDEEEDNYIYDDDDFGLDAPVVRKDSGSEPPKGITEITDRLIDDLRNAKDAGLRISLFNDANFQGGLHIFALSLPVVHLGLPKDTLEAWQVEASDYIVLLCKHDSVYPYVERFTNLSPGSSDSLHFRFGKCTTSKPTWQSAIAAFNNNVKETTSEAATYGAENSSAQAPFCQMPMSNSINAFMKTELALLLKYRLSCNVSWDGAKELLQEHTKSGHLRLDDCDSVPASKDAQNGEPQVSSAAHPRLNRDYVLNNPKTAGPLPQDQLSMPLIAMQFALRYFVKSTHYCVVCHRKAEAGLIAIKPYVCTEPLCLFQYMALGMGSSIEHEIIAQPSVVDLLVTFCAMGLSANRIREWPRGLGIKVPLFTTNSPGQYPTTMPGQTATPPNERALKPPIPVRAQISTGRLELDRTQDDYLLKAGDLIVLFKSVAVTDEADTLDVHHCRIKNVVSTRNANGNVMGRTVEFDCLASTSRHSNMGNEVYPNEKKTSKTLAVSKDKGKIEDNDGDAEMSFYDHDLDDLPQASQREALLAIVQTIPPILELRNFLLGHKDFTLDKCSRLTKSALALLRWIVASNRSFIVQLDDRLGDDDVENSIGNLAKTKDREDEKIDGIDDSWVQFRFAQGSPEKEHRFKQALEKQTRGNCPTIFAWHGSPLSNWHSIIRSGLDFNDTLHGRAYGHGVYFSNTFQTSSSYSGCVVGGWINSELNIQAALSLCEIVNRPLEFRSSNPYYVVDKVDWIQCRYLLVKGARVRARSEAPMRMPEEHYIPQDNTRVALGTSNTPVQVPTKSLPRWRHTLSSSKSKVRDLNTGVSQTINEALEDLDEHRPDDLDIMLDMMGRSRSGPQALQAGGDGGDTVMMESDPNKLSFAPGTLDVASLPQFAPPTWATENASRLLGKELSKLQKLQGKTPLHELGWYIDFENVTNMFQWIVELHSFELSLPLAQDMKRNNVSSIVLEIRFGQQFPLSPPFVRVIRPRFLPFSQKGGGHVTAGGAMCMELLTNSGWSPVSSMESVLLQVRMAMCNLEPFPARLMNASNSFGNGDYGVGEAIEAYKRAAATHGWQVPSDLDETARG
ncbi:ubiquitin conjugating enzyme [Colletotrichum sojae]|uniref:Ubiquitin conjugating enzyme n=1 Tax=Colletotrichum sojae TaxID=2175907 RepID=A0A8H6N538_9PEZI|nr:ubiquitin conjugating enzyme [Colletotrichum sojae]